MTVSTTPVPARMPYQAPILNAFERTVKRRPPLASTPASSPPLTEVIPARYTVEKNVRPRIGSKGSNVTADC